MTLLLSRRQILKLLDLREVIAIVETAHADLARGRAVQPAPPSMTFPTWAAKVIPMVAALEDSGTAAVKVLTDTTSANGEQRIQRSTIMLIDSKSGACEAILHGAPITLLRTAAASAVATKHLSRADSRVLGLIGAGAQARAHFEAIRMVRPVDEVIVWSRRKTSAERLAREIAATDVKVTVSDGVQRVVESCDVLCTITPSKLPIVRGEWFRPGLHVNAVGAPPRADHREIDSQGILRARVIVDSREHALESSGEAVIPLREGVVGPDHFGTELGEVIAGLAPGRADASEITLFNSIGVAVQDVATARHVVDRAHARGVGTHVDLVEDDPVPRVCPLEPPGGGSRTQEPTGDVAWS